MHIAVVELRKCGPLPPIASLEGIERARKIAPEPLDERPPADTEIVARQSLRALRGGRGAGTEMGQAREVRLAGEAERSRDGPHHNEAYGPGCLQVDPAKRYEFETEIAVNRPRQAAAGADHGGGVCHGDQHGRL